MPLRAQEAAPSLPLPSVPQSAQAVDAPEPSQFHYVLGVAYGLSPSYAGSDERKARLRPVLALQYGRFRLSSSRGSSVLRHGLDASSSGASATLVERDRLNISASLRIDNGRSASEAVLLQGLPEVRSTLRGRLSMGYALTDRWSLSAGLSQDLLGRAGGAQLNTGLQYAFDLTPQTRVNFGVGAAPGGGLFSVDAGMGVMTALNRRWVAFGSISASQLRGDARRSPLTVRPNTYSATAGVAYRCCP